MGSFSYSKVVSDELLSQLLELANQNDQTSWAIGDLVNEVAVQAEVAGTGFSHNDICKAFGAVLGIRAKDLRIIADVATVFPQELRDQHPILTWGHFLRAMGPKWEANLKWMEDEIDKLGRPASVDAFLASGEGTSDVKEHPAEIAKANQRKRTINVIGRLSKDIQAGKLEVDQTKTEKINRLIAALLVLLNEEDK